MPFSLELAWTASARADGNRHNRKTGGDKIDVIASFWIGYFGTKINKGEIRSEIIQNICW